MTYTTEISIIKLKLYSYYLPYVQTRVLQIKKGSTQSEEALVWKSK